MSGFEWHPRDHRAALDGMLMLTLEERGAYNTILDLIYDRRGPIPDDSRWLAGWMGVSLKRWATIRASLRVKGKIYEVNLNGTPSLMNERAAIELENQAKRARNSAETGAKGGRKRAENARALNENNDIAQGTLEGSLKLKTETKTVEEANASCRSEVFPVAWKACTPQMRKRSKAQDKTLTVWQAAARKAGSEDELLKALRRYLREDPDVGRTGGPGFHIWLADGKWQEYLRKPEPIVDAPTPPALEAQRLRHFRDTGEWRDTWGPRPTNLAA